MSEEEPAGYVKPQLVHLVEIVIEIDGDEASLGQIGGFFSREEAEAALTQLEAEGRSNLVINTVSVHTRAVDWQYDR